MGKTGLFMGKGFHRSQLLTGSFDDGRTKKVLRGYRCQRMVEVFEKRYLHSLGDKSRCN
jgi:hypothetical protein